MWNHVQPCRGKAPNTRVIKDQANSSCLTMTLYMSGHLLLSLSAQEKSQITMSAVCLQMFKKKHDVRANFVPEFG